MSSYTLHPMEPAEKFIHRFLKFVFVIVALIVAIVFGEFYRGMGWFGVLIFIIGVGMSALALYPFKGLKN